VLFSIGYSEFKTESEQYSTPRWKTPKVQHEEQKAKMLEAKTLRSLQLAFAQNGNAEIGAIAIRCYVGFPGSCKLRLLVAG
jgi:hypothetical protein